MARLAKSLNTLRAQVNASAPNRSKISDGWIADQRHVKAGTSDHIPNKAGIVAALDITNDPANGLSARKLAEALVASKDRRIKYIISEGQIVSSKVQPWKWRKYTGTNGHFKHVHISVDASPALYDDASEWTVLGTSEAPTQSLTEQPKTEGLLLREGDRGDAVAMVQQKLIQKGYLMGKADSIFGPKTKKAVQQFQTDRGLRPDGIVGKMTLAELVK